MSKLFSIAPLPLIAAGLAMVLIGTSKTGPIRNPHSGVTAAARHSCCAPHQEMYAMSDAGSTAGQEYIEPWDCPCPLDCPECELYCDWEFGCFCSSNSTGGEETSGSTSTSSSTSSSSSTTGSSAGTTSGGSLSAGLDGGTTAYTTGGTSSTTSTTSTTSTSSTTSGDTGSATVGADGSTTGISTTTTGTTSSSGGTAGYNGYEESPNLCVIGGRKTWDGEGYFRTSPTFDPVSAQVRVDFRAKEILQPGTARSGVKVYVWDATSTSSIPFRSYIVYPMFPDARYFWLYVDTPMFHAWKIEFDAVCDQYRFQPGYKTTTCLEWYKISW